MFYNVGCVPGSMEKLTKVERHWVRLCVRFRKLHLCTHVERSWSRFIHGLRHVLYVKAHRLGRRSRRSRYTREDRALATEAPNPLVVPLSAAAPDPCTVPATRLHQPLGANDEADQEDDVGEYFRKWICEDSASDGPNPWSEYLVEAEGTHEANMSWIVLSDQLPLQHQHDHLDQHQHKHRSRWQDVDETCKRTVKVIR